MNLNKLIRQVHRWLTVVFTVAVIIVVAALGQENPPLWVGFLVLIPLAVLFLTGLYLFVLPYATRWRSRRNTGGKEQTNG